MKFYKIKSSQGSLGKNHGCEKAPDLILEGKEAINVKINPDNIEESNENIFNSVDEGFIIGGDHSISYSRVKAFRESFENPFLIVFDAHADCMRIGKEPTPTHEQWLRKLVEEGFPSENIILIAARNIWPEEQIFLKKNNIQVIGMEALQEDIQGVCDAVMERARNSDALYISIDIDSVDPAFAPGTGYIEPGGLSSRELIYFLHRLKRLKNFKAADIVEINSETDKNFGNRTIKLGAKILAELF